MNIYIYYIYIVHNLLLSHCTALKVPFSTNNIIAAEAMKCADHAGILVYFKKKITHVMYQQCPFIDSCVALDRAFLFPLHFITIVHVYPPYNRGT